MALVISIVNQKGGVGKTTTAISLAACLAATGRSALLVDLDPQANATTGLGVTASSAELTVYDCLQDGASAEACVRPTALPRLSLLPASIDLAGAEIELVSALARETKLRQALSPCLPQHDFIIIDSPPSLGLLTINSLAAADAVIIPVQCEFYALTGVAQLLKTLSLVRQSLNPRLDVLGVLLTMYDARTRLSEEVASQLREHFRGRIFRTVIPRNIRLTEAPSHGTPVGVYAPGSRGARAYDALAQELLTITGANANALAQETDDGQAETGAGIAHPNGRLDAAGGDPGRSGDRPDQVEPVPAAPECGSGATPGADGVDPGSRSDSAALGTQD